MKFFRHCFVMCAILIVTVATPFPKDALSITVQKEDELSQEFMTYVLNEFELVKDPYILRYINHLGQKINAVIPDKNFKYNFYIIKEDVYNAFAGPGGHVFVNSGLFEALDNEEQLAGILSHEIAHVECRHISQRIERSSKIQAATLAGMIAGALLGTSGAGMAGSAVVTGAMAAGQSVWLAYSREDERQADQIGLKYLNDAGYSAAGLLTALKKIRSKQWFDSKQIPTYLTTHPASEERMAYIDTWIERSADIEKKLPPVDPHNFETAHIRLLALYGDENTALMKLKSQVEAFPEDTLSLYGYGLVLSRIGNRSAAVDYLRKALKRNAFDPTILAELGKIYFADGRYPEALQTLTGAVSIDAYDPEGLFFLGRTQMELAKFEDAVSSFEKLIAKYPFYSDAYYFLGEAYGKQGDLGNAHYYLGVYYMDQRHMKNSEFHLAKALKHLSDPEKMRNARDMLDKIREKSEKSTQKR